MQAEWWEIEGLQESKSVPPETPLSAGSSWPKHEGPLPGRPPPRSGERRGRYETSGACRVLRASCTCKTRTGQAWLSRAVPPSCSPVSPLLLLPASLQAPNYPPLLCRQDALRMSLVPFRRQSSPNTVEPRQSICNTRSPLKAFWKVLAGTCPMAPGASLSPGK